MKNKNIEKQQSKRTVKRALGEYRIEGRLRVNGSLPAKQRPYWYCDKRKRACLTFDWYKFVPEAGVPAGGSTALVVTKAGVGKVLVLPRHYAYEQTARLFRQHGVVWWSRMPGIPDRYWGETQVLGSYDFDYNVPWVLPESVALQGEASSTGALSGASFALN